MILLIYFTEILGIQDDQQTDPPGPGYVGYNVFSVKCQFCIL